MKARFKPWQHRERNNEADEGSASNRKNHTKSSGWSVLYKNEGVLTNKSTVFGDIFFVVQFTPGTSSGCALWCCQTSLPAWRTNMWLSLEAAQGWKGKTWRFLLDRRNDRRNQIIAQHGKWCSKTGSTLYSASSGRESNSDLSSFYSPEVFWPMNLPGRKNQRFLVNKTNSWTWKIGQLQTSQFLTTKFSSILLLPISLHHIHLRVGHGMGWTFNTPWWQPKRRVRVSRAKVG